MKDSGWRLTTRGLTWQPMAEELTQALNLLSDDRKSVYRSPYTDTVSNLYDHAESLYETVDTIMDYENARSRLSNLDVTTSGRRKLMPQPLYPGRRAQVVSPSAARRPRGNCNPTQPDHRRTAMGQDELGKDSDCGQR
jgi:hypothetical protein